MTILRFVTSWIIVLFLTWRGSLLFSAWLLDQCGIHPLSRPPFLYVILGMSGPDVGEALRGCSLWAGIGLAVVSPWLSVVIAKITRRRSLITGLTPLSVYLNTSGRWAFAMAVGLLLASQLPRPMEAFVTMNPDIWNTRFQGYFTGPFQLVFLGILSTLAIAPEIALMASSGFTGFIDGVFFPGSREKKPPYSLKLARFYVEKNRWEDAEAEFTRVLAWHPEQLEAWQERLRAAQTHAWKSVAFPESEPPDPQAILAQGLKCLKSPADKEALFAEFNRLRNGGPHTQS